MSESARMSEGARARVRVWDLPVRAFHWGLAVCFVGAYTLSESERQRGVHALLGYTALALIALRVLWGFIGTRHARFASFWFAPTAVVRYLRGLARGRAEPYLGHNPAGSYVIYAMLALGLLTGASGYCSLNDIGGERITELHELLANGWLALVIVHVAGVIVSSLLHRENLVRAMITGQKPAPTPLPGNGTAVMAGDQGHYDRAQ